MQIDLRKAQRDRTQTQPFQIGLALAKHLVIEGDGQQVVWNSLTPAVPVTVQMLVCLEEYAKATKDFSYFQDQEIVFWIVRPLFKPIRSEERIPIPMIGVCFAPSSNAPLNPMAMEDDIPFMLGKRAGVGGRPEHPSSHIQWARDHANIRDQPLSPKTNPLAVADAIQNSDLVRHLEDNERRETIKWVRLQALSMVSRESALREDTVSDQHWSANVQKAKDDKIQRDAERESFVSLSK